MRADGEAFLKRASFGFRRFAKKEMSLWSRLTQTDDSRACWWWLGVQGSYLARTVGLPKMDVQKCHLAGHGWGSQLQSRRS